MILAPSKPTFKSQHFRTMTPSTINLYNNQDNKQSFENKYLAPNETRHYGVCIHCSNKYTLPSPDFYLATSLKALETSLNLKNTNFRNSELSDLNLKINDLMTQVNKPKEEVRRSYVSKSVVFTRDNQVNNEVSSVRNSERVRTSISIENKPPVNLKAFNFQNFPGKTFTTKKKTSYWKYNPRERNSQLIRSQTTFHETKPEEKKQTIVKKNNLLSKLKQSKNYKCKKNGTKFVSKPYTITPTKISLNNLTADTVSSKKKNSNKPPKFSIQHYKNKISKIFNENKNRKLRSTLLSNM